LPLSKQRQFNNSANFTTTTIMVASMQRHNPTT